MAIDDTTKKTILYSALVSVGVVFTTLFVLFMSLSIKWFAVLILIYLIAYSTYTFTFLMIKRDKFKEDLNFEVMRYISLYNLFFTTCMLILLMVLTTLGGGNQTVNNYNRY